MRRQGGFSYVIVMFVVAIAAILSVRALSNSATNERRDREAELLWVGQAYRDAIKSYYENTPGSAKTYPPDLAALLLDQRTTTTRRHLRKLYRDPVSGGPDWGLVLTDDGKVKGVYSLSTREPVKVGGFPPELAAFAGAKRYQDWKFVYQTN